MYETMSTEVDSSFDGLYRGAMVDGKKNLTSSPSTFSSVVYVINMVTFDLAATFPNLTYKKSSSLKKMDSQ